MRLFFEPRSVVLIGVSRQSGPGAYNNLEMMLRYGYRGLIYVVHPKVPEILGKKTFSRVADLPETPDLAIISLGRDRVLPVFAEIAAKGIQRVIVISQGFADADEPGKKLQHQLVEMARKHGIRVVGPNTLGVLNNFSAFSTAFVDIEKNPAPPPLTIVVQSGVFQVGFECFTGPLGKGIDIGNASDVDFVDVLEYLENDPQTELIVLHMEGMRHGRRFLQTAERVARTKPILVLKTGRSAAGAKAALSHTGSLVGEDAVFDAAFAKAGLIRVRSMIELRAACQAFLHFRSMTGPRIGVVTASGACGIMTADACEDYGLELAPFPERLRLELENSHIAWHRLHNPVDLWPLGMVSGSFTEVFKGATRGLLKDERVDAVLGIAPTLTSPLHKDLDMISTLKEVNRSNTSHKPLAMWLYGGDQMHQAAALAEEPDIACFGTIDEAIMGLAAFRRYRKYQQERKGREHFGEHSSLTPTRPMALAGGGCMVGEAAFELLKHYHIPVVPGGLAQDVESSVSLAADLGYPVVVKIISPDWLHKSDWGGIRLRINTEAELRSACAELEDLFRSRTPAGKLDGLLVQKQVEGTELLLGIKRDPQFGPVLVAGMGGIYTEIFRDVARALVPVSVSEGESLLRSLRSAPILKGVRGQKGAHLASLAETIASLSRLAMDYPEISELDLNPVVADSEGCWCVDCRIVLE